jgi:hypothetical protein
MAAENSNKTTTLTKYDRYFLSIEQRNNAIRKTVKWGGATCLIAAGGIILPLIPFYCMHKCKQFKMCDYHKQPMMIFAGVSSLSNIFVYYYYTYKFGKNAWDNYKQIIASHLESIRIITEEK